MHASTGHLRGVPGYAFPFSKQTELIQKHARLQSVDCPFILTPDVWESAQISSSCLSFSIFLVGRFRRPLPRRRYPLSGTMAQTVGRLRQKDTNKVFQNETICIIARQNLRLYVHIFWISHELLMVSQ